MTHQFSKWFYKKKYSLMSKIRSFLSGVAREEQLRQSILHGVEQGVASDGANLIVSLTTFSKRIFDVSLSIESIMQQTIKPKRIILCLNEDEFDESSLPVALKRQRERGLEIKYYNNIRSYLKLIPTLKQYPDDVIVTIDDDVLYASDLLENLYNAHLKNPEDVICTKGVELQRAANGKLKSYKSRVVIENENKRSDMLVPLGVHAVLYPPHCFHEDVLHEDLFMKLAPTADDLWFKTMTLLKGRQCQCIVASENIELRKHETIGLYFNYNKWGANAEIFKRLFEYYKLI